MDAFVTVKRRRKLLISDVKTRVGSRMPNERASHAARMQLSLYHQLLSKMINGNVDMNSFLTELRLDSDVCFSDEFLVESETAYSAGGLITFDTIIENNNLTVTSPSVHQAYPRNYGNWFKLSFHNSL